MAKLRVFFVPFYATGHMIPLLDLAFLFSGRPDVEATIVTTPANAALLQPTIDHYAAACGRRIGLLLYPFPSAEADVLPGQENISAIPYADIYKMCKAGDLSRQPISHLLHHHRADAVVADVAFWWMPSLARELNIPNIVFHAIGVFPQFVMDSLHRMKTYQSDDDRSAVVAVTDIPGQGIQLPRSELPRFLRKYTHLTEAWTKMKKAQMESYGVVVNTFYGMEGAYCKEYRRTVCRKAWFVGPVACAVAKAGGGRVAAENCTSQCLKWLDGKKLGSVVFICFGSWCSFSGEQLKEIALGLEESGKDFLWVVRDTAEEWMPGGGWEERMEGRGLVVRGWGPQVTILGHKAVGGFMTHCGWNSVMEAAAAGVGVLTWPLVFEQFMSERLVVEEVGAGGRVWEGFRSTSDEERMVVPKEAIGRAVKRFMEGGGAAARRRARELAAMAHDAVVEGGDSWKDLNCLIDELIMQAREQRMELGAEDLDSSSE